MLNTHSCAQRVAWGRPSKDPAGRLAREFVLLLYDLVYSNTLMEREGQRHRDGGGWGGGGGAALTFNCHQFFIP